MDEGCTNYNGGGKLFVFTKKRKTERRLSVKLLLKLGHLEVRWVIFYREVWQLVWDVTEAQTLYCGLHKDSPT